MVDVVEADADVVVEVVAAVDKVVDMEEAKILASSHS